MNHVIKSVISAGGYRLAEIQHKVKKLYLLGDITEDQMDELLQLAAEGVSADAERPELLTMIHSLAADIETLKIRLQALEGCEDAPAEPYPAWKAWDGISSNYPEGSVVSHNGQLWISVFSGQNVWEPGKSGTGFWVIYTA